MAVSMNWGGPFVGVPVIRALLFCVHIFGPLIFGNSQMNNESKLLEGEHMAVSLNWRPVCA